MNRTANRLAATVLALTLLGAVAGCSAGATPLDAATRASAGPTATASAAPPASTTTTAAPAASTTQTTETTTMKLTINGTELTATLAENSSARALRDLLADGPRTIQMSDYGSFEKVGDLGQALPTNDEQITTAAGDLILYQGRAFVIYDAPNSWNFTRLGRIEGVDAATLKSVLGEGDVAVTLDLES